MNGFLNWDLKYVEGYLENKNAKENLSHYYRSPEV